jgi:transposase
MGIYSKDLRIRAVAAVVQGLPTRVILETFSISLTTLKRWLRMMSSEGKEEDLSPGDCTGPRLRILATLEEKKKASWWSQLQENDDATTTTTTTTVERHCELWNQGTAVAVCR